MLTAFITRDPLLLDNVSCLAVAVDPVVFDALAGLHKLWGHAQFTEVSEFLHLVLLQLLEEGWETIQRQFSQLI